MLQQSDPDLKTNVCSPSHKSNSHPARVASGATPTNYHTKVDQTGRSRADSKPSNPPPSGSSQAIKSHFEPASVSQPGEVSKEIQREDTLDTSLSPETTNGAATPPKIPLSAQNEAAPEQGFLPVLRNRNFLALWSGQVFSQLADKVYLVLMIALIESHFHSGDRTISAWVSAIMIAFTIPAVLFGSLAGVFVDRWSKRAVLVATNLLRGGLVVGVPLLLWLSQGWGTISGLPAGFYLLLLVTFLVSTLTQFFAPAEQAAIPLIVERRHLLSANSLYTTTMMASVIVGFAVGQPVLDLADSLMASVGIGNGKELIVGGSYALAGVLLLLLKTNEKTKSDREAPHILEDLRDGLRYLKHTRRVRTALIQLVILFSIFAALSVLAVRLAEVIPGLKPSQFGFLMAAGGIGMGVSAAILGHFGQGVSHTWLSLVGSSGVAAALIGLALLPHQLWIVLLLVMLLGGCGALVAVPMQTTIQKETPPEMRGKVFGLQNNGINIALTLPLALAGVAETLFGLQAVFLGLGAAAIAGGLLTWYICRTSSNVSKS
ncbi:MFS transporter [Microseira sp. BLCC-F43]|uniref:MFS transporter n=1 Tax=Microseira sp. BLCC-F43 TaxID=3153602 RepID=UPI0035B91A2E